MGRRPNPPPDGMYRLRLQVLSPTHAPLLAYDVTMPIKQAQAVVTLFTDEILEHPLSSHEPAQATDTTTGGDHAKR